MALAASITPKGVHIIKAQALYIINGLPLHLIIAKARYSL